MGNYQSDRQWSDRYLSQIYQIVGPKLLEPAAFDIDAKEATDLIVLKARDMRIGCRLRREGYASKYPYDFTIRAQRDSGAMTEMAKIVSGWGDWLFYGHVADDILARWFIINLDAFREHMIRDAFRKNKLVRGRKIPNGDGTHFLAFDVRKFPERPPICVDQSHTFASEVIE